MNWNTLTQEVGYWAEHNFTVFAPQFGFGEEIGEFTHIILKQKQGIRGYGDASKVRVDCIDAIGDAAIYLAHWCYLHCPTNVQLPTSFTEYGDLGYPLGKLYHIAAELIDYDRVVEGEDRLPCEIATSALAELTDLAASHGWRLMEDCVVPTWEIVKKRNWRVSPISGTTLPD
jgi:hypothetical protein